MAGNKEGRVSWVRGKLEHYRVNKKQSSLKQTTFQRSIPCDNICWGFFLPHLEKNAHGDKQKMPRLHHQNPEKSLKLVLVKKQTCFAHCANKWLLNDFPPRCRRASHPLQISSIWQWAADCKVSYLWFAIPSVSSMSVRRTRSSETHNTWEEHIYKQSNKD